MSKYVCATNACGRWNKHFEISFIPHFLASKYFSSVVEQLHANSILHVVETAAFTLSAPEDASVLFSNIQVRALVLFQIIIIKLLVRFTKNSMGDNRWYITFLKSSEKWSIVSKYCCLNFYVVGFYDGISHEKEKLFLSQPRKCNDKYCKLVGGFNFFFFLIHHYMIKWKSNCFWDRWVNAWVISPVNITKQYKWAIRKVIFISDNKP